MRKFTMLLAFTAFALLTRCTSDDDDPSQQQGQGGGDITITSIAPDGFYADDELVISGTGFSTDLTKLKVEMGAGGTPPFMPFATVFESDPSFVVISATSTQIVAKAVDVKTINYYIADNFGYRVRVTSGDKTAIAELTHTKQLPVFNLAAESAVDQVQGCFYYLQAGDSVHMEGLGFYGTCQLTIDDKIVACKTVAENKIYFMIPRDLFGELDDNCTEKVVKVVLTNGDGKKLGKEYHMATSPPMQIYSAKFTKDVFTPADNQAMLTIKGYCLYASAMIGLVKVGTGYVSEGNMGATNYTDQVVVPIGVSSLQPGSYQIQVKKNSKSDYTLFPIAEFKVE